MINVLFLHSGAEMYGADIILLNLLKRLHNGNVRPIVILPNSGILEEEIKKLNIECYVLHYPILRRKYMNPKGAIKYLYTYFKSCNNIKRLLESKKVKIDIIHSNTSAVLEGIFLKYILHAKLIFHIHEMISHPYILKKMFPVLFRFFGDSTICVSNAVKEYLDKECFNKNSRVIYNGIDTDIFNDNYDSRKIDIIKDQLGIPKDKVIIGMIGRVNAIKGQDELITSFLEVYKKNNNVQLLLVGGVFPGQEWRFSKLSEKIQIINQRYGKIITISDYRKDNYLIHNVIDIFVLPSIDYDSFPTVVLESLATSKPVVAYNCGGVVEMIENGVGGYIIEWRNVKELARIILQLSQDANLRKKIGINGKKYFMSKFSLSKQISQTESLYRELLK